MSYILYTANNCHGCALVVNELEAKGNKLETYNVDESEERPPIYVVVYPALFENGELVAYGQDILRYFEKKL